MAGQVDRLSEKIAEVLQPFLQFWRSVFERRAPQSITEVEKALPGISLGQGNWIGDNFTDVLLGAITASYEEAAGQGAG